MIAIALLLAFCIWCVLRMGATSEARRIRRLKAMRIEFHDSLLNRRRR